MSILLNGKVSAQKIREKIKEEIEKDSNLFHRPPTLAVVVVGDDPASKIYVAGKQVACKQVGIKSVRIDLDESCQESKLLDVVHKLNNDDDIDGIFKTITALELSKRIFSVIGEIELLICWLDALLII